MVVLVFCLALVIGGLLGFQIGSDKRFLLDIEIKHLRNSLDNASADSKFWRELYQTHKAHAEHSKRER